MDGAVAFVYVGSQHKSTLADIFVFVYNTGKYKKFRSIWTIS